jgi:glyoxylate reductase
VPPVRVYATRELPSPRWAELVDAEIGPLPPPSPRPGVNVLVAANEHVDATTLDRFPDLRLVANFGVGYDRVDVTACKERDVAVTNTPGVLDAATADLAFALILAARRRVAWGDALIRRGGWTVAWPDASQLADEVTGSTLGIVGLGRIGSAVARRAAGFELRVLYTARTPRSTGLAEWRPLDELLRESDIVTLHVPLTAVTRGLIDARRLALLRDGTTLVNTARAQVVDHDALLVELRSGRLSAALDVFPSEPGVPPELVELENVVLTPHLGSATKETRAAMADLVIDNILALAAGRPLLTPVD